MLMLFHPAWPFSRQNAGQEEKHVEEKISPLAVAFLQACPPFGVGPLPRNQEGVRHF